MMASREQKLEEQPQQQDHQDSTELKLSLLTLEGPFLSVFGRLVHVGRVAGADCGRRRQTAWGAPSHTARCPATTVVGFVELCFHVTAEAIRSHFDGTHQAGCDCQREIGRAFTVVPLFPATGKRSLNLTSTMSYCVYDLNSDCACAALPLQFLKLKLTTVGT